MFMQFSHRSFLLLSALLPDCRADAPPERNGLVAQRGDVRLTGAGVVQDVLEFARSGRPGAQVTATQQTLANFTRERVLNMAILAEATAKKWDSQPDIVRKIAEARNTVITQTYLASLVPPDPAFPTDAEVTSAYEANKARLVMPRQYHLAQIVLTVKPGATPQEDEEVHKKAEWSSGAKAVRPNADFADLARKTRRTRRVPKRAAMSGGCRSPT